MAGHLTPYDTQSQQFLHSTAHAHGGLQRPRHGPASGLRNTLRHPRPAGQSGRLHRHVCLPGPALPAERSGWCCCSKRSAPRGGPVATLSGGVAVGWQPTDARSVGATRTPSPPEGNSPADKRRGWDRRRPSASRSGCSSIRSRISSRIIPTKRGWASHQQRANHRDPEMLADRAGFDVQIVNHFHVLGEEADRHDHHVADRAPLRQSAPDNRKRRAPAKAGRANRCGFDRPASTRRVPPAGQPAGMPRATATS